MTELATALPANLPQLVTLLFASYGIHDPARYRLYLTLLADVPAGLLAATARHCLLTTERFLPTVAEIRGVALDLAEPGRNPDPDQAWTLAIDPVGRRGHPLVKQAAEHAGTPLRRPYNPNGHVGPDLSDSGRNVSRDRDAFQRVYRELLAADRAARLAAPALGLADRQLTGPASTPEITR